ncbi:MAG: hypothetical protein IPJ50_19225 [Betaproteobacteria bacterium]|nr:hypothetical protein [Betaproteobacteria bacterium]
MLRIKRRIFEAGATASQQSADPFEAVARLPTAAPTWLNWLQRRSAERA